GSRGAVGVGYGPTGPLVIERHRVLAIPATWSQLGGSFRVRPIAVDGELSGASVTAGDRVWLSSIAPAKLLELDPGAGAVSSEIWLRAPPVALTASHGEVWAALGAEPGRLARVSGDGRRILYIALSQPPVALTAGPDAVYAADRAGEIWRISVHDNRARRIASLGRPVEAIAFGHGRLWAAVA